MRSFKSAWYFIFLFFNLTATYVQGQSFGTIEGTIVDLESGEAMIGVSVMLQGTSSGAATDLDGRFVISNVPIGIYTLVATYVGYDQVTVTNVVVDANRSTTLNFTMRSKAIELGEVVIEAREVNNTEAALLQIQKRAPSVADGISAEQIKKSPDSDAADAVKRVTGVTVIGEKYVYVRGMGERYNNTRMNGATIASPEPLKRTVPFDVISANMLDNIVVSKTFTPDQPGDFAGGSVQLNTKEFPEKLTIQGSVSSSYNDQTSLRDFMTYPGGDRDFFGMDDGTRDIPKRVKDVTRDISWKTDTFLVRDLAKEFSNVWDADRSSAPMNGSRSLAIGNQSRVLGKTFGYLLSVSHSASYSRRTERQFSYTVTHDTVAGTSTTIPYQDFEVNRSSRSVNLGGILDLNAKLSDHHKVSLKSLYSRSADDEARLAEGLFKEERYMRSTRLVWTERSLFNAQLKGAHDLSDLGKSRAEWSANYSRATYDQPDRRDTYYNFSEVDTTWQFLTDQNDANFRRYAKMRDDTYEGMADWSMPLGFVKDPSTRFKFGVLARRMERNFPTRKFYYDYKPRPNVESPDLTLPPELLFSPRNIDRYFELNEITLAIDSYEADMNVLAGYVMTDYFLSRRWRATGGVRVERTDQHFKTFPVQGGALEGLAEGGPRHVDVLPSLNLTYKVNDRVNLRAAGSMTIANPDYAELVPTRDNDYFEGAQKEGNPKLRHTKIYNGDLRMEFYPKPGENLAIGLFYKNLKDPIEWVYQPSGATETLRPENFVDARNLGAEIELRRSFDFLNSALGSWASYFTAIGNFALISSNVVLKDRPYDPRPQFRGGLLTSKDRPLMGQSEYVVNATLAFDHPLWGSSARLLFNTFGERISQVGAYGVPDTYEQPFDKLDMVVTQRLGQHWLAKATLTNLLNSDVTFKTGGKLYNTYKIGRTYGIGLTYSI